MAKAGAALHESAQNMDATAAAALAPHLNVLHALLVAIDGGSSCQQQGGGGPRGQATAG